MKTAPGNPLAGILARQSSVLLDGGLATTLEARGHSLHPRLWSAGVLLDAPEAIRDVHEEFLEAGADCISTATYQASLEGFRGAGLDEGEALAAFDLAVEVALEARDRYLRRVSRGGRLAPLVAASVGPYGAFLSDGSEYDGRYRVDRRTLEGFHGRRFDILASSSADLIACETIPSLEEVSVLLELLRETPGAWAWISVSCSDGSHLSDGSPLAEFARVCDGADRLAAIGVNCMAPAHVEEAILTIRDRTTAPLLVYPNSGEVYDSVSKSWRGNVSSLDWGALASRWVAAGAQGVGGCCRVGPEAIRDVRRALVPELGR